MPKTQVSGMNRSSNQMSGKILAYRIRRPKKRLVEEKVRNFSLETISISISHWPIKKLLIPCVAFHTANRIVRKSMRIE